MLNGHYRTVMNEKISLLTRFRKEFKFAVHHRSHQEQNKLEIHAWALLLPSSMKNWHRCLIMIISLMFYYLQVDGTDRIFKGMVGGWYLRLIFIIVHCVRRMTSPTFPLPERKAMLSIPK